MLAIVNERIGVPGSPRDGRRIAVIVLPGNEWFPPMRISCDHPWVQLADYGSEPRWWCPCGPEFGLVAPGRSLEDEVGQGALRKLGGQEEPGEANAGNVTE